MSFKNFDLASPFLEELNAQNIEKPTPIQEISYQALHEGQEAYLLAQTGSGKTLAYLLPLLQHVDTKTQDLQILILAPTHELCSQIIDVAKSFSKCFEPELKSMLILGDTALKRQIDRLKKKPHLIVASAGRALDLISQKKLKVHKLKSIVIDEADRMLEVKNQNDLKKIIAHSSHRPQMIYVSATQTKDTETFTQANSPKVQLYRPDEAQVSTSITHAYYLTHKEDKLQDLQMLIKACKPTKTIIFVHHQDTVSFLLKSLRSKGRTEGFTRQLQKQERQNMLNKFRKGEIHTLITTDISARGLDIPDVSHVIQYDVPKYAENYLHRAGRTGRINKEGGCISMIEERELKNIRNIEKRLNINIEALN